MKYFIAAMVATASLATAQTLPNGAKPTGPRMVLVDVQVTDGKNPIRDLKANDFVLEEGGERVPIALFDVTEAGKPHQAPVVVPDGVSTNRLNAKGEVHSVATVMLFDRINSDTGDQSFVHDQILRVLAGSKPTDHLGFYSIGANTLRVVKDYDEELGSLPKVAAALLKSGTVPPEFTPAEQTLFRVLADSLNPVQQLQPQARVNMTYPIFRSIGRHLGGVLGTKNLIWITSAFPLTYGNSQERRQEDQREVEQFTRYLNENNIVVYPVDPSGAGGSFNQRAGAPVANEGSMMPGAQRNQAGTSAVNNSDSSLTGTQTMQQLADTTGGKAYRNVNDISDPLREILGNTGHTYTLGFYPPAEVLDGRNRDIKVTIPENKKATISHRKKYWAWGASQPAAEKGVAEMQDVLDDVLISTRVGLAGIALAEGNDSGKTAVTVKISAGDIRFDPVANDQWEMDFSLVMIPDGGGLPVAKDYKLAFPAEQMKMFIAQGMDVQELVETGAKPGFMHVALVDKKSGLSGSLLIPYGPAAKAAPAAPAVNE